jgi:hypothetical protein
LADMACRGRLRDAGVLAYAPLPRRFRGHFPGRTQGAALGPPRRRDWSPIDAPVLAAVCAGALFRHSGGWLALVVARPDKCQRGR